MSETVQQKVLSLEKRVGPNSKSPLFAQLASFYLLAGRAQDALRVCDEGIANFPFYTTGHLVKAKVLLTLNMSLEARRELEIVREFLPTNTTINRFLTEIPTGTGEIAGAKTIKPKAKAPLEVSLAPQSQPAAEPAPVPAPAPAAPVPPEVPVVSEPSTPKTTADFFGISPADVPAPPPQTPAAPEPSPSDPFGFGSPAQESSPEQAPPPAEPKTPVAAFPGAESFEGLSGPSEEESFERYAARKRSELGGVENTLSLEDYLGGAMDPAMTTSVASPEPQPEQPQNEIEELTQKLQGVKKITPVINLADKSTVNASETETPASTGFVTPTLAEIYAKQGWFDDAIKAYRTLAINKPAEREKYEKRILELEEQKKEKG